MIFRILTLFPERFQPYLSTSIIGRSIRDNKIEVSLINFRDFSNNKHHKVDDTTYGGGPGMVLQCEPLYKAIKSVYTSNSKLIFLTPQGKLFKQSKAWKLTKEKEIILVCGSYEGFDQRIFELFDHETLSIGDYVLTSGELAALVVLDSITRLLDNVLHNPNSLENESFTQGLLEYDQYTKPDDFLNLKVPEVLLSGDHHKIELWRKKNSLINTIKNRPDLLEKAILSISDIELLISYFEEKKNDYE
ncbi:MAG: tRNA (guanosine(37)-N1)-methyltransferase TrmD [Spirochaetota bacterium]|nr:tRNA (guanosine(37)-N1)-methyltransferase TrmD [Spirochaetota bacterium]